ncbi:A/G-specific adenine glycosylase [Candidatus Kaiserbacteria bacterium]|nr:A/G-specific adenine glycosylase [Candidatus Kaiserbacteria bacterium]
MKGIKNFKKTVIAYWEKSGRHDLPWRHTHDPYRILVSEIMLQQTPVDRVIPYYRRFLRQFPTVQKLAKSDLTDVLEIWSGLGYNRRAKMLRDCARVIVEKYGEKIPRERQSLESLPGIGPYTAGAIRAFAYNEPDVFIETNIRTAFLYHFYGYDAPSRGRERSAIVSDMEILEIAKKAAEGQDPREWHSALMDYGAHLKRGGIKLNHKSAHYIKQSKFEGSLRQVRGKLLRRLIQNPITKVSFKKVDAKNAYRISMALQAMEREGLIVKEKDVWRIVVDEGGECGDMGKKGENRKSTCGALS